MTCQCQHIALAHQYRASTAANDGECLAPQCPCGGYVGASVRTFPLQTWENGSPTKDGPGVGALTPTESQGLDQHTCVRGSASRGA
jgi:hypothetical protein